MHDTILSLFSVPILHGHIDPPVGLVEELTSKYDDCTRGVWSSETGYSTGELGMLGRTNSSSLNQCCSSIDKHSLYMEYPFCPRYVPISSAIMI